MRLSVLEQDPGFGNWRDLGDARWRVDVFVDGELVRSPVTADDEKGLVFVYAQDLDGKFIMAGDTPLLRCIEGRVRIFVGSH